MFKWEPYDTYSIEGMGDHKSHIRHEDTSHVWGPYVYVGAPYESGSI